MASGALALGKLKTYAASEKEQTIVGHAETILRRTGLAAVPEDAYLLVRELAEMIDVRLGQVRRERDTLIAEEQQDEEQQDTVAEEPVEAAPGSVPEIPPDIVQRLAETQRQLTGVQGAAPEARAIRELDNYQPLSSAFKNDHRSALAVRSHTHLGRIYAARVDR